MISTTSCCWNHDFEKRTLLDEHILFLTSFDKLDELRKVYVINKADITCIVLTPHATLDCKTKSSGWVSRGDWSYPSSHTLWNVKITPPKNTNCDCKEKPCCLPYSWNVENKPIGNNTWRHHSRIPSEKKIGDHFCWSRRLCRLGYATTHATNMDRSSKFGTPKNSSTLP